MPERKNLNTLRWALAVLCLWLASAHAEPAAKGLAGYPPEVLPAVPANAQVHLGWRDGDGAPALPELQRQQLIAELNALRTRSWQRFDGKAGNPVAAFRVSQPGGADLWFTLTAQDISQLRNGPSLTGGGHWARLPASGVPALRGLLNPQPTLPLASTALMDGDLIFQTSRSSQSLAVQRATGSAYSHMGMVVVQGGQPQVLEAVATVRTTPLAQWVARGVGGHHVVKRLRNAPEQLNPAAVQRLRQAAFAMAGRPYDLVFGWSDDHIYCSELVWKAYDRALGVQIGALQRVRDFKLTDPAVRAKLRERYGDAVPLDEPVISPVAMFNSPLLMTVLSR